jgi:hypothetical protein
MARGRLATREAARHTDPDFNGPGCPSTYYIATAEAVVPAGARIQAE